MATSPSGMFNFDPGRVLMGQAGAQPYMRAPTKFPTPGFPGGGTAGTGAPGGGTRPPGLYPTPRLPGGGTATASGIPESTTVPAPQQPSPTLGAGSVRASGTGPYDPAYRQDLATYAGGQFFRPGGNLTFNPTGNLFGNPTGGGNAPVLGTGTGLLDQALGGQPFSYAPQAPQGPSTPDATNPIAGWQDWIQKLRQQGNGFALNL